MLQEGSRVIDDLGSTWDRDPSRDWRTVDRTLRGIARRRAALDVEEARWLYEAQAAVVVHRADGGSHAPSNLRLHCGACHLALHRGTLALPRAASSRLEVRRCNEPASSSGAERDPPDVPIQARDALVGLGFQPAIARAAVEAAWFHVGPDAAVERLIREALRRCPTKG